LAQIAANPTSPRAVFKDLNCGEPAAIPGEAEETTSTASAAARSVAANPYGRLDAPVRFQMLSQAAPDLLRVRRGGKIPAGGEQSRQAAETLGRGAGAIPKLPGHPPDQKRRDEKRRQRQQIGRSKGQGISRSGQKEIVGQKGDRRGGQRRPQAKPVPSQHQADNERKRQIP
jgi:hypothetical protein